MARHYLVLTVASKTSSTRHPKSIRLDPKPLFATSRFFDKLQDAGLAPVSVAETFVLTGLMFGECSRIGVFGGLGF